MWLRNTPATSLTARNCAAALTLFLRGPQSKLLGVLIEKTIRKPLHRDELAEAAGYAPGTGTFNTYLGSLNALVSITDAPERGHVAAAEWLFPNARISTRVDTR